MRWPAALPATLSLLLSGCSSSPAPTPMAVDLSMSEPLYRPARVQPGELAYAPDGSTFAPLLTERFPYPTQRQANDAYRRLTVARSPFVPVPAAVRLFGCKPGLLDPVTARVVRMFGPAVHCATDLLDVTGRPLGRVTANFRYDGSLWSMQLVEPPGEPVPWIGREPSPKDPWGWVPGRDRYE